MTIIILSQPIRLFSSSMKICYASTSSNNVNNIRLRTTPHSLHWLPVTQRIKYKILLLTYFTVNGHAGSSGSNFFKSSIAFLQFTIIIQFTISTCKWSTYLHSLWPASFRRSCTITMEQSSSPYPSSYLY